MRARLRRLALGAAAGLLAGAAATTAGPRVEVVATGLEAPWALAFAPDGRLFVTERPGRIRVVKDGRLDPWPITALPVAAIGEGGLMGLATDPNFLADRRLYVCYTTRKAGRPVNRVARLTVRDDGASDERVLLDDMPGAEEHDGCRVKFGPDGKLYVTTGDAAQPALARRPDSLAGKILRLNPDGSVPADNPFPGSPVYALGLHNPQGIAWDRTGRMFASDFGAGLHDEINEIVPGGNYGWPAVSGITHDPRYRGPIIESAGAVWKPSGIAIRGDELYVTTLLGRQLLRIALAPDFSGVRTVPLLDAAWGRLRDVVVGPDGALYVATSNRDGRGSPHPGDDRILRVRP